MVARKGAERMASAAAGGAESGPALQLRSATITAVSKGTSPWTVTITVGGVSVPGVNSLGWLDPQVGDEVQVLQSGSALLVLGTVGPGKVYVPGTPPPAPPAPVVPPPAPGEPGGAPVVKPYNIAPDDSGTFPSQISPGAWVNTRLWQGGSTTAQRAYWFYGDKIAIAKGTGTIVSGSIFIRRWSQGGVFGPANVRLGSHGLTTRTGTPSAALSNVATVGALQQDQGRTLSIPSNIIAAMNAGTAKGLGLEPGSLGVDSPDYLVAYPFASGSEWSGAMTLNILK